MLSFLFILFSLPTAEYGYQINDGKEATVVRFKSYRNLIVIPAQLNDTLTLNLVLDTGTKSLILFGPKVNGLNNFSRNRKITVNGLGSDRPSEADFSFPNRIVIGDIIGNGVGAALLRDSQFSEALPGIDGIIGYELFIRFCVRIDYPNSTLTFYDNVPANALDHFNAVDLSITNQRPEVVSTVRLSKKKEMKIKTLIDTGSSLGLVVFSNRVERFSVSNAAIEIGVGLAGRVVGSQLYVHSMQIGDATLFPGQTNLVASADTGEHTISSSVGGNFLKDFVVMFDYATSKFFINR